ncbi:hypothetical protein [Actinoplanes couchii]|uniref:Uncharacterized protein n=1 Tax=Actinoplanes couchii TaxID=403638 RepID=A0ABQ3XQQ6_9ACTN|nr:hypothetical protein [Actinoplanes couchii]MDR6318803.1 hypothetical protein [Actinoplanes couchii]GID60834.1 hypothetical protein Aco03nite_092380 [Actinoplanes couchii]
MVYDDDPNDPPQQEFTTGDMPMPAPIPPPSPELYDLIAEVVKDYWDEGLARKLAESRRRQRARQVQPLYELTKGMVLWVQKTLHPGG